MAEQKRDQVYYNLEAIRQLFLGAFTAEELRRFCLDRPLFRPIVDNFGPKYNLNDMVDEVLFYGEPRDLFDRLVAEVRQVNPRQVARFEERLHDPHYTGPAAAAADQAPLPLRKLAHLVKQAMVGDTEAARALRNRQAMLRLVSDTWVKGFLESSVHRAALIELGKEELAEAVERPWEMVVQMPGRPSGPAPPGMAMVELLEEMGGALLILGEPGSGKTITLLQLAREAIARAEADVSQPIPAVLHLSSWAARRLPLAEWLADELTAKYQIPKRIGRPWIEQDALLLLLDGLDEVDPAHRQACVEAINRYRGEHGRGGVVVCCRAAEYQALPSRLQLNGAILLQPLTAEQVDGYLAAAGPPLAGLRAAVERDPALAELAQTPLMLGVMALAYRDLPAESLAARRPTHLFAAYVSHVFQRRGVARRYTRRQTITWLTWLAQRLEQHSQTVFLLEELQPSWLVSHAQRWLYVLGSRAMGGLLAGLAILFFLAGLGPGLVGRIPTAVALAGYLAAE
jgi:hypothetical protein